MAKRRIAMICTGLMLAAAIFSFAGCMGGFTSEDDLTPEQAKEKLDALVKAKVEFSEVNHQPDNSWVGVEDSIDELPEIDMKYPLSVMGGSSVDVEIFSSTEKSNKDGNGWLDIEAKAFNKANSGKMSVSIRPIASGLALGYLSSGKYIPGAYSPANDLWTEMLRSKGLTLNEISAKLTGNEAGILMKKDVYAKYAEKYGEPVTVENAVKAVIAGDLVLAHTDPNISSTGFNIMTQELRAFDSANPFSESARKEMREFADKVPAVSPTTAEMVQVASKGLADAIISEYQSWKSDPSLKDWIFTPVGVRHDSPLYAFDNATDEQKKVLAEFAKFCESEAAQKEAAAQGFNPTDNYAGVQNQFTGAELYKALEFWKQNKDAGRAVLSVFVVDRSGSMEGESIHQLKASLLNAAGHINEGNYIGLVSYSSMNDITVDLPIAEFTPEQHSLFCGAVNDLNADGGTATNDALVAGIDLLVKTQADANLQGAKLRVFLLSDGQQNEGLDMDQINGIINGLGIPIYTIGYNAELESLEALSSMNEAYCINAESSDVIIKLKELFTAQL